MNGSGYRYPDGFPRDFGSQNGLKPAAEAPTAPSGGEVGPKVNFRRGDRVRKVSGASWHGIVVGEYSTSLTPEGYAVESENEPGSVQIYPVKALALLPEPVDADLIAAREAEAKACEANGFHDYAAETRAGKRDDGPVRHRFEGIKLGRALAAGDR